MRYWLLFILLAFSSHAFSECPIFVGGQVWVPSNKLPLTVEYDNCKFTALSITQLGFNASGSHYSYNGYWALDGAVQLNVACPYGFPGQYQYHDCPYPICPNGSRAPFGDLARCVDQILELVPDDPTDPFPMSERLRARKSYLVSIDKAIEKVIEAEEMTFSLNDSEISLLAESNLLRGLIMDSIRKSFIDEHGNIRATLSKLGQAVIKFDQHMEYDQSGFENKITEGTTAKLSSLANLQSEIDAQGGNIGGGSSGTNDYSDADDSGIISAISGLVADGSLLGDFFESIKEFFTGTESAYSESGQIALSGDGDNPLKNPDRINVSTMLDQGTRSGSCPAPISYSVLGRSMNFDISPICPWAGFLGALVIVISSLVSFRIIVKEVL